MRTLFIATLPLLFTLVACGDEEPVSYSEPVGIELKADADKVVAGSLTDDKGITTESGNPYSAFIANARDALGGADPSHVDVSIVSLLLGADSTGVTTLGEIFDGNVEVLFEMNDTNDTVAVASGTLDSQTPSTATLAVDFDSDAISTVNYDKLLSGSFKVVYRGSTQATYAATDAKADLQITFTFEAFE
jgi:hypothetical protein